MKLKEVRARRLFTVRALAKQSGVSEASIHSVEQGKWLPSLGTIAKLSEALGVKPEEVEEFKAAIDKAAGQSSQ